MMMTMIIIVIKLKKKKYWTELSENTQSAPITGNIRGSYNGIKKALRPTLNKTAPLRSSTVKLSRIEDICTTASRRH